MYLYAQRTHKRYDMMSCRVVCYIFVFSLLQACLFFPFHGDLRAQNGGDDVKPGKAITSAAPEVWRWFVGAALLIAFIEWYIYNRRVLI